MYNTRKTVDLWDIQVDYGYGDGYETVYTAESLSEAKARKKDYIASDTFAKCIRIVAYRERRNFNEHTIFSVLEKNGKKLIKILATSYYSGGDEKPYCLVEYCWFEVPLTDVLQRGFSEYENSEAENYKQFHTDVNKDSLFNIYTTYNDGKMPRIIDDVNHIDRHIPQGMYIVKG